MNTAWYCEGSPQRRTGNRTLRSASCMGVRAVDLKIRRAAKGVWKSAGSKVRQRDSVSMNVIALSPQLKYKALTKAEKSA